MEPVIFIAIAALVIAAIIFGIIAERKRREALLQVATQLGLRFSPDRDRALGRRYGFLDKLARGSNRYAFNTFTGGHRGHDVQVFDYHYETHSTDSKGRRQTHHHHLGVHVLRLERDFPELVIAPEGFFSKIAQAFGYDDIDFESHEFSSKFVVRSQDKKFAYDFCHSRMMEHLLANPTLNIELDANVLSIIHSGRLKPENIASTLDQLITLRGLMPDYLFDRSRA